MAILLHKIVISFLSRHREISYNPLALNRKPLLSHYSKKGFKFMVFFFEFLFFFKRYTKCNTVLEGRDKHGSRLLVNIAGTIGNPLIFYSKSYGIVGTVLIYYICSNCTLNNKMPIVRCKIRLHNKLSIFSFIFFKCRNKMSNFTFS